jgi:uncharacterized protein (DUF362 family)/NAD-dependent dihydropyrimidine dehydrogenase PreA subunit
MSKVALIKCESYTDVEVKNALLKGLTLLGGAGKFARSGEKILLKPNFLAAEVPEKCVTTHPSIFKAVAEIFQSIGAEISYGDSPALGSFEVVSKKAGFFDIAEELGVKHANFNDGVTIHLPRGRQNKVFSIAKAITETDGVISIPKLKTHGLLRFTGCLKNQFGCVPGLLKAEFHVKCPDAFIFAKMLVDLNTCIKPRLYIMDGVFAMEGNGPQGGNPRKMNVILLSEDPVACDATACRLINCDPLIVPTTQFGQDFGIGTHESEKIELVGDDFNELKIIDFDIDRSKITIRKRKDLANLLNGFFIPKPVIDQIKCIHCGLCEHICPVNPKAVNLSADNSAAPPTYNYRLCIRCFCCQEICPENAISIKKVLGIKIFLFLKQAILSWASKR